MTPAGAGFCSSAVERRSDRAGGETGGVVEGEQLMGRFTVGERLGSGGHGTVHRAWDERLCRWVAVKAIEGEAAGRVLREAHAAARLNHPGIVTLYELGSHNGVAYLVSEFVAGGDLRELAGSAALSDREVAEIGAELCAALEHAHAAGVIHRDVKPDNVLLRPGGGRFSRGSGERAVLADFGIASLDDSASLTATGQVVGTLAYMSPEQAAGTKPGPASDAYSLALTLYELWAGFNPVLRTTPAATVRAIGEPVESLGLVRPDLPVELCGAVDACLRPDPDERPGLTHLHETLLAARAELRPDRVVPAPLALEEPTALAAELPRRPLAVLVAAAAIALLASIAGLTGVALLGAALLVPAALLLPRPTQWLQPAVAPLLGALGAAPAFLPFAARAETVLERAALAALAWTWTATAGAILGHGLGVGGAGESPAGWASSAQVALSDVAGALFDPRAIALGLIWVGAAVLLGALLDVARPAGAAVGGLVWAGCVAAAVATGPDASGSPLLAPALIAAVGWAIWDAAGRPELGALVTDGRTPGGLLALFDAGGGLNHPPERARAPRNPADQRMADERIRAKRAARRHVRAALHGAGSRGGLP